MRKFFLGDIILDIVGGNLSNENLNDLLEQ